MFWPCETRTSTCRNFATISSGLYRFLAITVLLDAKDIPQVGPLQWGRIISATDAWIRAGVGGSGTLVPKSIGQRPGRRLIGQIFRKCLPARAADVLRPARSRRPHGRNAPSSRRAPSPHRTFGCKSGDCRRNHQAPEETECGDRCACPESKLDTKKCNYGRKCAILNVDGKDVCETLISEGHARPYHCSATRCPPTRPWP